MYINGLTDEEAEHIKVKGEENKAKVLGCVLRIRGVLTKAVISERRQYGEELVEGLLKEVADASLTRMANTFLEEAFECASDAAACGADVTTEEVEAIIGEVEWLCARLAAMSIEPGDVRRGFGLKPST